MAASYPTSVKSFTTKVDSVDDVMASHINDLQAEVVAVETALGAGKSTSVIQVVNTQTGAYATGSTTMVWGDSIPQNDEGDEYMTLAITPKSATNKLKIDVVCHSCANAASNQICVALFQDTTANALACVFQTSVSDETYPLNFTHYMAAGTTSATTFKVRAGQTASTAFYFNGHASTRLAGGVLASSITITELAA